MAPAVRRDTIRWYFDESLLGAAKTLGTLRDDVVHPGHPLIPELPLGSLDTDWIPIVAEAGWVAFARDRRIRSRPAEADAFMEAGLRMVWFGGKKDLRPAEQAALFERFLPRLEQQITKQGRGPWGLVLTSKGLAPLRLGRP